MNFEVEDVITGDLGASVVAPDVAPRCTRRVGAIAQTCGALEGRRALLQVGR